MVPFLSGMLVFGVGVLVGCVGAGGVLVIPVLERMTGLPTHTAMGTALFSFIFCGILGTGLYTWKKDMDWRLAVPLCLGSVVTAYLGAHANAQVSERLLNSCLACIIIFSGVCSLRAPGNRRPFPSVTASPFTAVLAVGVGVGFVCGLTGAGGPILSVPVMIALGFAPLPTIAASMALTIVLSSAGSLANFQNGAIDIAAALWVTPVQLIGVVLGVGIAHKVNAATLKRIVAVVCIGVGFYILFGALCS